MKTTLLFGYRYGLTGITAPGSVILLTRVS